jgi:hypothetical protein
MGLVKRSSLFLIFKVVYISVLYMYIVNLLSADYIEYIIYPWIN